MEFRGIRRIDLNKIMKIWHEFCIVNQLYGLIAKSVGVTSIKLKKKISEKNPEKDMCYRGNSSKL